MLDRYSRQEMRHIWSEENKFRAWLKIEVLACEAWSKLGHIPEVDVLKIKENASFDINRIDQIEKDTKHDVIAFTRAVSESLGEEKKWVHYGLTSTDVVDTSYGYLFKQANELIKQDLYQLIEALRKKAILHKHTVQMGRTHGVHAEITTFGMKCALWHDEMNRQLNRFLLAAKDIEIGKISGAVGTHANIPIFVEQFICDNLGIDYAKVSTQTLQRDRHAHYLSVLALIATSLEKIAVEIRHLQRTEVREAEEYFDLLQKGSSAMPHKRNPIGSENIVGCARVMRGYMVSAYDNVALWHERDISHSSAERIIMPDATMLLDYMLGRMTKIIDQLLVYPDKMLANINLTNGVIYSQRVLLKLVDKGLTREVAYDFVQKHAMKAYNENLSFRVLLSNDYELKEFLSEAELEDCFDHTYHLKAIDEIFEQLGL
jgi:adenylosuccinate lyase